MKQETFGISFHSIGFPCERGVRYLLKVLDTPLFVCFHSIGFPCERGVTFTDGSSEKIAPDCFHSIGFPCERGEARFTDLPSPSFCLVSIQLVSPARGEDMDTDRSFSGVSVSIQLVSPARGEEDDRIVFLRAMCEGFHSIGFPCERGGQLSKAVYGCTLLFPFNWFPLREGSLNA